MNGKYEFIFMDDSYNENTLDEWEISKAIISDNVKQLTLLIPKENFDEQKLRSLKTFEPNLNLLATAAKHCKIDVCKYLLEFYRHVFDPNELVNDGTPVHWLVKSNIICENETNKEAKSSKYELFTDTFNCLISHNIDVNIKDSKGFTALHYAAMQDNYGASLLLLNNSRIQKEAIENQGMTALHIAARYGSESVALLLINSIKRENLSTVDNNKMLALHHACKNKKEQSLIVEKLLEKYQQFLSHDFLIDILDKKDKFENTILNLAIKENHLKIVEMLLKLNKTFKQIRDHDKNYPIHIAAKFGNIKMLELLEKYDFISFEPNNNWDNVFHLASNSNKSEFILELFRKYENNSIYEEKLKFALNAFNRDNFTPLQCAISKGSIDCLEILIKKQDENEIRCQMIEMFRISIENNQKKVLIYLLDFARKKYQTQNTTIFRDSSNNTILHYACIYQNFLIFKYLIDCIYDSKIPSELIEWRNQFGESVFSIACKNGCFEIVEYLLLIRKQKLFIDYDPLNDRDDEYSTPLHSAAKTNHMRILEILVENDADVNVQDKFDKIPLHYSCEIGSFEISKILINHKSKINTCDINNMTPLDYSCLTGHNEIVLFLLANNAHVHDINEDHYNCLDIAIDHDHKAVVETLLNDKNFSKFIYFQNEKFSKIKKLIKKMPLSMKILLDNCYNLKTKTYNFEIIDNPMYEATDNHPLWIMSQYQYKYLLTHNTIKKLLELKMKKWPILLYWFNLITYFIYLISMTFYHVNLSFFQATNKTSKLRLYYLWPFNFKFELSETMSASKKVYQIYNYGRLTKMIRSIDNWLEILAFLFNILSFLPIDNCQSAFGSLAVLLGWISFSFFFQMIGLCKIGSYSVALRKTIQNSFKFLPFFLMIYIGFLSAFKIRENFGIMYYNNTVGHIIRTITMMVGELQSNHMGIEKDGIDGFNYFTNNLIYICFLFIMCIIVLDLFIGIEVGEIKTVIDEAETQNIGINLIHVLKTQEILYKLFRLIYPNKTPTFMNIKEYYSPNSDCFISLGKRPDLLNRIENYLVSMSHELDRHINEEKKQMRELKEQIEIMMQQLDLLKKKIIQKETNSSNNVLNRSLSFKGQKS
ncbi:unnamed protein product [Brachionus calyciflorus]|uniref:Transient receptor potential cation channel subfamily A member 1 n=1 Tax=Brachionus calyciflorus TaxID=104777 RepID=A0A813N6W1_9BILA|nr:unnamed protein product [Brachionus calyciflorus]